MTPDRTTTHPNSQVDENLRAIAYSLDCLIPGFYCWLGAIKVRIGGSSAEASYSGTIHSKFGVAIVLPGSV